MHHIDESLLLWMSNEMLIFYETKQVVRILIEFYGSAEGRGKVGERLSHSLIIEAKQSRNRMNRITVL